MESIPRWQYTFLCGVITWICVSCFFNLTQKIRSLVQPFVYKRVQAETPIIIEIQVVGVFSFISLILWMPILLFNLNGCWFCRNVNMGIWMLCFLAYLVLFLCLFTLVFFHCSSGYAPFCVCVSVCVCGLWNFVLTEAPTFFEMELCGIYGLIL